MLLEGKAAVGAAVGAAFEVRPGYEVAAQGSKNLLLFLSMIPFALTFINTINSNSVKQLQAGKSDSIDADSRG
ncbi:unnamed protein product [Clonostachys solani]|uniref:Uncharacterized protein n=1 Tax=Clonostachys solani TaxID=160281 RepID=A0A9N9W7C7_9HYPO|nr:unnamed protein product [Clonostachys solani]